MAIREVDRQIVPVAERLEVALMRGDFSEIAIADRAETRRLQQLNLCHQVFDMQHHGDPSIDAELEVEPTHDASEEAPRTLAAHLHPCGNTVR